MSRLLIIPDIHGRKFWREALANNIGQVDRVIFLGDYLDSYGDEIEENPESMECEGFGDSYNLLKMLNDIIGLKKNEPGKYILLTGNHTDSYIWSKFRAADRTDYKNWEKYHKFFSENLNLFNLVWTEDNVIFSHAGISEEWAKLLCIKNNTKFKSILNTAKILQYVPIDEIPNNTLLISLLGQISHYRGGEYNYGSCEWADIREHINFKESTNDSIISNIKEEGIFQVFGHSQVKIPIRSNNWICLDCRKGFIFDTITHECSSCL